MGWRCRIETIVKQGKLLFAVAIAALGAENLICAHVSQTVFAGNRPGVPVLPFVPTPFLAYLVGIVLLAVGVSVAANIRPGFAATFLGLFFFLYTLVHLVACRRVTITSLLASKLSWPVAAKSYSPSNSIPI